MAVYSATGGSDDGLDLVDGWSRRGRKYRGRGDVEAHWRSFRAEVANPITVGTLIHYVKQAGRDWLEVCAALEPPFEPSDFEVVDKRTAKQPPSPHPLDRFSLRDRADVVAGQLVEQKAVLGEIALSGQATAIYAAPNTGKTLVTIALLVEGIRQGRIEPGRVYFVNVDDTTQGLLDKLRVADEFRFHMLAEGYRDSKARSLLEFVSELTAGEHAHGTVLVLDTMKKFVNLMDKAKASGFAAVVRRFVLQGGTVIALAHVNKHPRPDGTPVYSGTSDVVDDFDCAYTVQQVAFDPQTGEKVIRFENLKRRGDVAQSVAYRYTTKRGLTYEQMPLSVEKIDDEQRVPLVRAEIMRSDAEMIAAVEACIREGNETKMQLAHAVAERTNVSRGKALALIERYTGDDPALHRWRFTVRERGAKVYELLAPDAAADVQPPAD